MDSTPVSVGLELTPAEAAGLMWLAAVLKLKQCERARELEGDTVQTPYTAQDTLSALVKVRHALMRQELAARHSARSGAAGTTCPARPEPAAPVAWALEGWITARGQFFASKAAMPRHEQETAKAVFSMATIGKPRSVKGGQA